VQTSIWLPSAINYTPGEVADGPDAVAATYRELFTALPDMHFDIKPGSLCHHGDLVMTETCLHGTHRGPFRGLPPTGRRLDVPFLLIFQFDGPELVSERVYYDRLSLFIQLGVARDPNTLTGRIMTLLNHPVTVARAALRSRRIDNS
jgi:predicted ester cyclase